VALKKKYQFSKENMYRDVRPVYDRAAEVLQKPETACVAFAVAAFLIALEPMAVLFADVIFIVSLLYFLWLFSNKLELPFKLPQSANCKDPHNKKPGGIVGNSAGILYIGNDKDSSEEIWFNNEDARTHILYLGTTGSGKTEGLKSLCGNALCWASGFIYIDGKADTDLWSTLSNMARRFGRDDDILIMNYMTGNASGAVASNTLNPFSSGSASYLTNMLVSLMPDAEGDNAMWKERAVALVSALMPCLVWKRENQNIPVSVSVIRKYLGLPDIIKMSRDSAVPEHLRAGLEGYLTELPGYVGEAFDDEGNEQPLPPDMPPADTSVPRQQHGYLSMQFTRSLQSLGDDYGFIFDTQAADVDMMDVVLNRRILVTLIPALEKSSDETANLGKIIASTLKGMMGATLGHTVEGATETAIENKPTNSPTPFMAIFDEVGYYAAQGMAVMAAQARSLGFCLVYAAQDLPAMEKRVKEEARSITANCNIKLFGKLEDPTQTKDFFEKTVGQAFVTEVSGFARSGGGKGYDDGNQASVQLRARADYDTLRSYTEGNAICAFGESVTEVQIYYSNPGHVRSMRVQRFLPVPPPGEEVLESMRAVNAVLKRFRSKKWDATQMAEVIDNMQSVDALAEGFAFGKKANQGLIECGMLAVAQLAENNDLIKEDDEQGEEVEELAPVADATPEQVGELGGVGPLSWLDVIGADDSATSPAPAAEVAQENPTDAEMSWGNLMGGEATAPVTTPSEMPSIPPQEQPQDQIQTQAVAPEQQVPADQNADTDTMSWGNLMGGEAQVPPEAQPQGQPQETQSAEHSTPPVAASAPEEEMGWEKLMGNTTEVTPAAPPPVEQKIVSPMDVPPAQSQTKPSASEPQTTSNDFRPMSWADVIGESVTENE